MDLKKIDQVFHQTKIHAPLLQIADPILASHGIKLFLKREDLIHSHVSGNKWRKLKYNLIQAATDNYDTLLTFGGAYSNYILATAHAGQLFGFRTIGIIRGEAYTPLNPVLAEAQKAGMELHYMERWRYRQKESKEVREALEDQFGRFYLLPEGGTNQLAVQGCREIMEGIGQPFDVVCCACGTGGTLAGLISGLTGEQRALGFAVLKGEAFLQADVQGYLPNAILQTRAISQKQWDISFDYHFGGYAKENNALLNFIEQFRATHNVQLDPIYTGKLIFGLYDLIQQGYFDEGKKIIAIHTGKT